MKKNLMLFLLLAFFLMYSCAGKPDVIDDGQPTNIDEQLAMINEQLALINEQLLMLKEQGAEITEDTGLPKAEESAVTEDELIVEEEPHSEEEPVVEEEFISEDDPLVEKELLSEEESVIEEELLVEEEPITEEELLVKSEAVVDEEPLVEAELISEEEPVAEEESVIVEEPLVEVESIAEEETVIEEEPFTAQAPAAEREPVIAQTPLVENTAGSFAGGTAGSSAGGTPVIEEALLVEERPPVEEELIAEEELFVEEELSSVAEEEIIPFRHDPLINIPTPAFSYNLVTPENDEVIISRIVNVEVGQIIEIPFRGTGWVYLGELASLRGIAYNSRRYDTEGQSFIFLAEAAGVYILKFYRQDFIRDYIIYDHVQITVEGSAAGFVPAADRTRIVAQPRWPSPLGEAGLQRSGSIATSNSSSAAQGTTQTQGIVPVPAAVPETPTVQGTASATTPPQGTTPAQGTVATPSQVATTIQGNASTQRTVPATTPSQVTTPAQGAAAAVTPVQGIAAAPAAVQRTTQGTTQVQGNVQAATAAQGASSVNLTDIFPLPQTASGQPLAASETPSIAAYEPPVADAVNERQEKMSPEEILKKAKEAFDEGNTAQAIALLDQYMEYYPAGSDEVYWLYGQLYEANTPGRNMLLALDYYRRLAREFPQSGYLSDARRRIAYIERFYINIR